MRLQLLHFHALFKTWPTFQELTSIVSFRRRKYRVTKVKMCLVKYEDYKDIFFCLGLKYPLFVKQKHKNSDLRGLHCACGKIGNTKKTTMTMTKTKTKKTRAHFKTRLPPVARSSKKLYYLRRAVALMWTQCWASRGR